MNVTLIFLLAIPLWCFMSVHPLAQWPVATVLTIFFSLAAISHGSQPRFRLRPIDLLFFTCLAITLLLWILKGKPFRIGHVAGYTFAYMFFFLFFRHVIAGIRPRHLERMLVTTALFGLGTVVADWIMYNLLGTEMFPAALYPENVNVGRGGVIGGLARARGIFPEPGYAAWFVNTLSWAILVVRSKDYPSLRLGLPFVCIISAVTLTVSSAGAIAFLAGTGVAASHYAISQTGRPKLHFNRWFIWLVPAALLFLAMVATTPLADSIGKKVLFAGASGSDRLLRYSIAFGHFLINPIDGIGLGRTVIETGGGVVSLYLTLLSEGGLLLFAPFLLIWWYPAFLALKSNTDIATNRPFLHRGQASLLLGGITTCSLHYMVVTGIDAAWPWLFLSLVYTDMNLYSTTPSHPSPLPPTTVQPTSEL
jgi:hypothetical protein